MESGQQQSDGEPDASQRGLPFPPVQLITGQWSNLSDLESRVTAAMRGGIRWVQLRAKDRPAHELYKAALRLALVLGEVDGHLLVNDRVDVALACGARGVHLPEAGMSAQSARMLIGPDRWLARSVHSIDAVQPFAATQLDAVQFGPIFDTASKRRFGQPQGLSTLARAVTATNGSCSLIAVGGITAANAASCFEAGASAIAVIGAIWDAPSVESAAQAAVASVPVLV